MIDTIIIIIALASLNGIIIIVRSNSERLSRIDINNLKKTRQQTTKHEIISRRLEGKILNRVSSASKSLKPITERTSAYFTELYKKVLTLEKKYRHSNIQNTEDENQPSNTIKLSSEIEELVEKEDYVGAEKKLIEMISQSPKNTDWYRQLGEIYMETKQYQQARETFEFVTTLEEKEQSESEIIDGTANVELANDYISLSLACRADGDLDKAVNHAEKACRLEANNPRNLSLLLDLSLEMGNKILAWEAFDRLKNVNPDNMKLKEFEIKIKELEKNSISLTPKK